MQEDGLTRGFRGKVLPPTSRRDHVRIEDCLWPHFPRLSTWSRNMYTQINGIQTYSEGNVVFSSLQYCAVNTKVLCFTVCNTLLPAQLSLSCLQGCTSSSASKSTLHIITMFMTLRKLHIFSITLHYFSTRNYGTQLSHSPNKFARLPCHYL